MDDHMTTEIYPIEAYGTFLQQHVLAGNERIPADHYHAGIVVKRGGVCLAAAVLYINPHMQYKDKRVGVVGAYGAVGDSEPVVYLFRAIEQRAHEAGLDFLIGPMNGSTWEAYRFHDDPAKPLFFLEMMHRSYYPDQWRSIDFKPIAHYYSTVAPLVPRGDGEIERVRNRLLQDGITFRAIDMNHYEADLRKLYPFLQASFKRNLLYTPISESSFVAKYLPLKVALKPEFVQIAEHKGEVVGVSLGVVNLLDPTHRSLIIKTLARNPQRLYRGLGRVLLDAFYHKGLAQGYQQLICAFMIEGGDALPLSDRYHARTLKTYALYGKSI
ncbi:hypothetical protein [Parapedobacter sp.]